MHITEEEFQWEAVDFMDKFRYRLAFSTSEKGSTGGHVKL